MEIEIRLQKLLQDCKRDRHGIVEVIAKETGLHRHTVSKLYHNRQKNPSMKVLGRLCDWLQQQGVASAALPGGLLGAGASKLREAVAAPGMVTIFLGEYRQRQAQVHVSWISRRDSTAETEMVRWLSTPVGAEPKQPMLVTEYVPFRAELGTMRVRRKEFQEDRDRARRMFLEMRTSLAHSSAILIGSQRVNYLVEVLVADLFGCKPFAMERGAAQVPFHVTFPRRVRAVRSCFGSTDNPPGRSGPRREGTYYMDAAGKWVCCPWVQATEDSGIVITCYQPGANGLQLAILGFSGSATEAIARDLTRDAKQYWPPYVESRGQRIGVYICRFKFAQADTSLYSAPAHPRDMNITPIDAAILAKYLKK